MRSARATNPPRTDCCIAAPAVLEFDTAGNLLRSWGGPGYTPGLACSRSGTSWRRRRAQHPWSIGEGNVWISGSSRGDSIQKFTADGKLLWDFGHRGPGPQARRETRAAEAEQSDTDIFPGGIFFFDLDEDAREMYIVDAKTRARVRHGQGHVQARLGRARHSAERNRQRSHARPTTLPGRPPIKSSSRPRCTASIFQWTVWFMCANAAADRIQVFTKQGKFVTSFFVHPSTPARGAECGGPGSTMFGMCGTIYNLTFSHDPQQKYVLIADGTNDKVWIHDRKTGKLVSGSATTAAWRASSIGSTPSPWIRTGNIYTGEVDTGKRVQKFILTNGDKTKRPRPHE